jgi:hypothetical protein
MIEVGRAHFQNMCFASVSGTEVHLLHIAMYCRKMKSEIGTSYTGTQIVYTSAIAALN